MLGAALPQLAAISVPEQENLNLNLKSDEMNETAKREREPGARSEIRAGSWFKKLRVSTKLYFIVGLLAAILVFIGLLGLKGEASAVAGLDTVYKDRVVPLRDLKSSPTSTPSISSTRAIRCATAISPGARRATTLIARSREIKEIWQGYLATDLDQQEKELISQIEPQMARGDATVAKLRDILQREDQKAIDEFTIKDLYPAIDPLTDDLGKLIDVQIKVAKDVYEAAHSEYLAIRNLSIGSIVLGLIAGLSLALTVIRGLRRELGGEPAYVAEIARNVAEGNLAIAIQVDRDDRGSVLAGMKGMVEKLSQIKEQVATLTAAAANGELGKRADASLFAGDWRTLVQGVNDTVTNIVTPLTMTADYIDRIAKGDIPPKITETYRGDFNVTKNNLNDMVDALQALIADVNTLADAGVAGALGIRADGSRHRGEYRRIVEGMNATLDAIVAPINEAAAVLERLANYDLCARMQGESAGDFAKIKDSLNRTAEGLHEAIAQVNEAVGQVASAAEQIAATSQSVAQGASEQASALEETASALEQMTGQTKQTADNTHQARAVAKNTQQAGREGQRGHGADGGGDGQHPQIRRGHQHHHQGHQRDRLPDQSAGAQRRGRGGARGRCRAGLRGGGRGGAQPRAAGQGGGQQDRGADRPVGQARPRGRDHLRGGQREPRPDRRLDRQGRGLRRGDRGGERGAGQGDRPGQPGGLGDGQGGAAVGGQFRGIRERGRGAVQSIPGAGGHGGAVPSLRPGDARRADGAAPRWCGCRASRSPRGRPAVPASGPIGWPRN